MGKSSKNNYYVSFDINTKDPNFYSNIYSDIRSFMIKNNFEWRKDSNYLSINRISKTKIYKFQRLFSKEFKENLSCINKIDWNIYDKAYHFRLEKQSIKQYITTYQSKKLNLIQNRNKNKKIREWKYKKSTYWCLFFLSLLILELMFL